MGCGCYAVPSQTNAAMRADRGARAGYVLAATVLGADLLTKAAIVATVELGATHQLGPVLNIVHVLNRGAAFSFLHNEGGWQRYFFIAIALAASAFLVFMLRRASTVNAERLSFGLILGGALANMFDRIGRGAVVDWIDLHWGTHHWPAFNIADIGITTGAALLVAHELFSKKPTRQTDV